jgi:hypothetical protein
VGQSMQNRWYLHLRAIKWIMRYLQRTCEYWLQFTGMANDHAWRLLWSLQLELSTNNNLVLWHFLQLK